MKEKIKKGLGVLVIVGILLFLLLTSIMDLTNKKDLHNVTIYEACEVHEVKHLIYGLIPIGTDHYYLGIDDANNAYLIKAPKKWLEKNFNSDYYSLNPNGIQIEGLAREVHDSQIESKLQNCLSQLEGIQYPLGSSNYIDLYFKLIAILKLVDFLLILIIIFTGIYIFKRKDDIKPVFIIAWTVGILISLILLIEIVRFI